MKQFFEQYGGVALGILALLVLIAMITPVGNIIKTSLQGTTETFASKMNSQTDTMVEQMSEAFKSATEFVYIGEDGKAYKEGTLYTGWEGDKAYRDGVEAKVYTTAYSCPRVYYNGDDLADATFLSMELNGKTVKENFKSFTFIYEKVAIGVTTMRIVLQFPSIYYAAFNNTAHLEDYHFSILSDDGTNTVVEVTGVLTFDCNGGDILADDFYLYLK